MRWKHIFPGIVLFVLITQVAVVKGDESPDYFVNANQLASEKKYIEAFVQYELAMQKEPGNVDIYISYGWYLFLDGNTDKAITITGKGYALDKTNRFIIGNLALYYSCSGDLARGDQFYDSFFKLKLEKWVYCAVFQEDIIDHKNMFKRDPDYTHTLTGYVSHGMSLYPDFESACATWREMKKYENEGDDLLQKGEFAKADELYNAALPFRESVFGKDHKETADRFNNIGSMCDERGDFDRAISYHTKALAIRLKVLGKDHPDVAISYNNIGCSYNNKGEYDKAIDIYEKSLAILIKTVGENHPNVASSYNNIGSSYHGKGEYDKAIGYYEKSLAIRLKVLGENHLDVAASYNDIGSAYDSKGEYDKAIGYYEKSLATRLKILGENHPVVATSYNNIGVTYANKGDYNIAIEYYEKSLAIRLKVLGENHPDVSTSYNNIGSAYDIKGEYDKAIGYYEKSLTIRLKVFGENHPDVASSYSGIGSVYDNKGEYDKAIGYYENSLAIRLRVLGENHPDSASSYNNIGSVYDDKGEYDRAIGYYEKSLAIRLKVLGENHPDSASSFNNIGVSYSNKGEYDKAIGYYQKSLFIRLKVLGENHPDVASSYDCIGSAYTQMFEYDKAIEYQKKALAIRLKVLGEDHPSIAHSYGSFGFTYYYKGDSDKALEYFRKSLTVELKVYGERHPSTTTTYNNIGMVYQTKGDNDKAIEYFRKALDVRLEKFGENHVLTATSYHSIGIAYNNKKDYARAVEYYAKALDILKKGNSRQEAITGAKDLGLAAAYNNNWDLAASSFEYAVSVIEQARETIGAGKTEFMSRNIAIYYYLLATYTVMKDTEKVFAVAESMRSRGFLDRLTLSAALSVSGVSPELKSKMLSLNDEIESLASRRLKEIQKSQEDQDSKLLIAISNELAAKEKEFAGLDDTLMKIDKYRDMRKPKIATLADAKSLCGKDKAIVEYVIWEEDNNEKQSYALVITSSGMKIVHLDAAFDYSGTVAKYREAIIVGRTDEVPGLSSSLYAKLIAPIEQDLEGISSVIIVPDGSLAFLPFDSLRKSADAPYLCEKFALSLQSSVSVMMMVRTRDYSKDNREAMLAFGGAVYDMNGKNTDRGNKRAGIIMRGVGFKEKKNRESQGPRGYYAAQGFLWPNIPGTKTEVQTIASNVFGDKGVTVVTGKDVTEAALKSLSAKKKLKGYHAVHLACHGYYDPEFPGYSAVVFSEVSQKDSAEDGYLSVEEAALLDMDADMVVLSACETGIGTIVRGDGVVGLTRAFNVAGANSVGVTLWTVDDNATNEFMVSVYKKMKEMNIPFAKAAYLTKMEFIKGKINGHDYSDPYFWSPFVVYGE